MSGIGVLQVITKEHATGVINRTINSLKINRVKLVLLVAVSGTGKTQILRQYSKESGIPIVSLGLAISKAMQEGLSSDKVINYLRQVLEKQGDTVLIDNIEVLFQSSLEIQVLQTLKLLARERTIVATFPGKITNNSLVYADAAAHPEYKVFSKFEIKDVILLDLNGEER